MDACATGQVPGRILRVFSNRPAAPGLGRAERAGIATTVLDHRQFASREAFETALAAAIERERPDWVLLAGFMRILGAAFVAQFAGRLVNIHPSLLPAYRGLDTHQRVLAAGEARHGASVHFVTAELDAGPLLLQGEVPVLATDDVASLTQRVHHLEHRLYPLAAQYLCSGRIRVDGQKLFLDGQPLRQPLHLHIDPLAPAPIRSPAALAP